jgi:hypothetical protein
MAKFAETRRFLALQACWTILRGGSVAYRINFTDGGGEALSAPTFFADCQMDGKPMTPWDIEHLDPAGQEDGTDDDR